MCEILRKVLRRFEEEFENFVEAGQVETNDYSEDEESNEILSVELGQNFIV